MRRLRNLRSVYYGWRIALALAITETISWGIIYYAFSVFISPMELDTGWTRTQLTGAFSLALLLRGAMAVPVGIWIDRHGARLLMTTASLLASGLVILWSQASGPLMYYLIWAGLGVCMAALFYEPAFTVIANWFLRRRARALAFITFIAGFASTIFLPLADLLLQRHGWRTAVLLLGIVLAITTVPLHALVLRRRPADIGLQPDGAQEADDTAATAPSRSVREVLRGGGFRALTAAFSLAMLAGNAIRVHFVPFLLDQGVTSSLAATGAGAIGAAQVLGRLFFAPFTERFSLRLLTAGTFVLQALALLLLLTVRAAWGIWLFVLLFGAGIGAATLLRPAILVQRYGAAQFGRISSVMVVFLTLAGTIAPVGAGALYDHFGSYGPMLWLTTGIMLAAMLAMLLAPGPATRDAGS